MDHSAQPQAPIDLTGDIADAVNSATTRHAPLAIAYVDGDGRPHLSLRGTVHVYGDTQLALWARSAGLQDALATNPCVALLYQDLANHTLYRFTGRARRVDDPDARDRIYGASPEHERFQDPDRDGTAVIVEVEEVRGRGPNGVVAMTASNTTDS
jgi:Pyridoxamine 5'-phosphate oxidase